MKTKLSFCVFEIDTEEKRFDWERKIISTLAQATDIKPSENWLGKQSPEIKIKESGLWQKQELDKAVLTDDEFEQLKQKIG